MKVIIEMKIKKKNNRYIKFTYISIFIAFIDITIIFLYVINLLYDDLIIIW